MASWLWASASRGMNAKEAAPAHGVCHFREMSRALLSEPTSVRVLGWVQIRGGGRLDRQLWHRNLVRDERVAASQGHAVLAMGPDLQGREGPQR